MAGPSQVRPFFTDEHLRRLLAPDVQDPWFRSLYGSLREILNPPKLPPLEVTSRPVAVKDIWDQYGPQKKCWAMSLGFQSVLVLLLFTVFSVKTVQQKIAEAMPLIAPDISPYQPKLPPKQQKMTGGGGGQKRGSTCNGLRRRSSRR